MHVVDTARMADSEMCESVVWYVESKTADHKRLENASPVCVCKSERMKENTASMSQSTKTQHDLLDQ